MVRCVGVAGVVGTLWLGIAQALSAGGSATKTVSVKVHCRSGETAGFVTPNRVRANVGDDIEWKIAGNVDAESLEITLKDATQSWPFEGEAARGSNRARSGAARDTGTYGYNVRLKCKVQGGESVDEVIDPDIIIL
jgi:plastocyanin